jgi:hypothetical protein
VFILASAWLHSRFTTDIVVGETCCSELGKGIPTRNYHACLKKILNHFSVYQGFNHPMYGDVSICGHRQRCRLYFPFAYIIGDALSGDRMCGRYGGYTKVTRISRSCLASHHQADDHMHKCKFISSRNYMRPSMDFLSFYRVLSPDNINIPPEYIDGNGQPTVIDRQRFDVSRKYLRAHSQHPHISAFSDVWFGENELGVNGATPNDLMHLFLLGILLRVLEAYFSLLFTLSERAHLDYLVVDGIHSSLRSSERVNFPRCTFSKGITILKWITASERVGALFSLLLVAMSVRGRRLLDA